MSECSGDDAERGRGLHSRTDRLREGKDRMLCLCNHSVQAYDHCIKNNKESNHCGRIPELGEPR
jgi:hypothetical protein